MAGEAMPMCLRPDHLMLGASHDNTLSLHLALVERKGAGRLQ
jgi:hypothetical protein